MTWHRLEENEISVFQFKSSYTEDRISLEMILQWPAWMTKYGPTLQAVQTSYGDPDRDYDNAKYGFRLRVASIVLDPGDWLVAADGKFSRFTDSEFKARFLWKGGE